MKDVLIPTAASVFMNGGCVTEPMPIDNNGDFSNDRADMAKILLDRFVLSESGSGRLCGMASLLNPCSSGEKVMFDNDLESGIVYRLFEESFALPRPMSDSVKNDDAGETLDKWLADYVMKTIL